MKTNLKLNKEQQAAADFLDGVCVVVAVPGAGKTLTMTHRIGNLVMKHGVAPESILGLSFTRNAAEAMREERPDVRRLIVGTSKQDGGFAKVSIRDVGPGIKENNVNRLFDPFYTTKAEGMGMGLAISKEIVKSHKGAIWAENNPDKGAVFFFTVPFDSGARP